MLIVIVVSKRRGNAITNEIKSMRIDATPDATSIIAEGQSTRETSTGKRVALQRCSPKLRPPSHSRRKVEWAIGD